MPPSPTFRHRMYDAYKAGRRAMPDELAQQMPVSRDFAAMLGLHILSHEGYEADDILGTLARMAEESGDCTAYLLTGDRDALQLISPRVHVLLAGNNETTDMDEAAFTARYGITPDRFVDVKALMGDTSDNIPGVPGVGEKTALRLIAEYGSVDGVYAALPTAGFTPSLRRKLEEGEDSARLSRRLAEICREVPLELSLDGLARRPMDRDEAGRLFSHYGFSAFLKRFGLVDSAAASVPAADAGAARIPAAPCADAFAVLRCRGEESALTLVNRADHAVCAALSAEDFREGPDALNVLTADKYSDAFSDGTVLQKDLGTGHIRVEIPPNGFLLLLSQTAE